MGQPSALFASSRCIKTLSIVIPVHIVKEYVQCAGSRYWTQSSTSKAMYSVYRLVLYALSGSVLLTCPFLQIWVVCSLVLPCISASGWIWNHLWIVLPQVSLEPAQSCFVQLMPKSVRILFSFLCLIM